MKLNLLIILFLACAKVTMAQDSIKIETVQDSFITPQYSTVYDDVFMNNKETKWLLKFDGLGLLNLRSINIPGSYVYHSVYFYKRNMQFEFEHKLNKNVSLNYSWGTFFDVEFEDNSGKKIQSREYRLGIEPRWYFRGNKSKMANNLNGSYIGMNLLYGRNHFSEGIWDKSTQFGIVTNYGIQRRVFNHFYINYQIGVGVGKGDFLNNINQPKGLSYWLNRKFTIGLALGDSKKGQVNTCDLFRCFEEEKSLWKLDLRSFYKTLVKGISAAVINPEFETKIKNSSFSLNMGLGFSFEKNREFSNSYGLKITIEPRYYYNLNKRVATGKSANNLSGNYFSIDISRSYLNTSSRYFNFPFYSDSTIKKSNYHDVTYAIEPKWGIQRRLFKNGFIDFSFSLVRFQKSYFTSELKTEDGSIKKTIKNERYSVDYNKFLKYNKYGGGSFPTNTPVPSLYLKLGLAF